VAIDIVLEKFNQWISGLNDRQARIAVFNHIRDIPYSLVPEIPDIHEWASSILKNNKGSCSPKHILLGSMFVQLGIKVKYGVYPFSWDNPAIKYPQNLRELSRVIPCGYHCAIKAYIDNKWVLVDATWDPAVGRLGFPINENWDGFSDTLNAVIARDEILFDKPDERMDFVKNKKSFWTDKEKTDYKQFIDEFNVWLLRERKSAS